MRIVQAFGPQERHAGPGANRGTDRVTAVTNTEAYCLQHSIKQENDLNEQ